MSTSFACSPITMELYETDIYKLQEFITNEKIEGEFTEEYLILYDFADDCKCAACIQSELIGYLLPFYLKTTEQAVIYKNKTAVDIYCRFNSMVFFNQRNFERAVGEKYQFVMEYYIKLTIKSMETENQGMLAWVPLFNTTVAFYTDNILQLFKRIFEGSLRIKYSFFRYLSVLLFKESDNLLAADETKAFWTSDIWDFDSQLSYDFFWNNDIVEYFDREIDREKIEILFEEIKPLLYNVFEPELMELFREQMEQSFVTGVFQKRKSEYLQKISCKSEKTRYWDSSF
ncbi:MAG: hypothetical protein J1E35_06060 [Lachnospiraceae bacterium]|nr:hypothetical protein [Lachnospiraceae bacterium]